MKIINMNTRTLWIDSLKAIAIFWIYLGHFGDNGKQLYQLAFSFHIPLFFLYLVYSTRDVNRYQTCYQ